MFELGKKCHKKPTGIIQRGLISKTPSWDLKELKQDNGSMKKRLPLEGKCFGLKILIHTIYQQKKHGECCQCGFISSKTPSCDLKEVKQDTGWMFGGLTLSVRSQGIRSSACGRSERSSSRE